MDLLLKELNARLADRDISVELTTAAKNFVTENGYDPVYGARPLKRFLQKNVETLAARIILGGQIEMGDTIVVDATDGKLEGSVRRVEG